MAEVPHPLTTLRAFPDPRYIKDVCKARTEDQCRFLVRQATIYSCGRNSEDGTYLGTNGTKPINCGGVLEQIGTISDTLIGKKVLYEDPPFFSLEGTVQVLDVDSSSGTVAVSGLPENINPIYREPIIDITDSSLSFRPRHGIPSEFTERFTIVFEPNTRSRSAWERVRALFSREKQ